MGFDLIRRAYTTPTQGSADKAVLAALAFHADRHGYTFVGQETLARECQLARETVLRVLRRLETAGLIRRTRRNGRRGQRTSDGIVLSLPELAGTGDGQCAPGAHAPDAHDCGSAVRDPVSAAQVTHDHRNSQPNLQINSQNRPSAWCSGFEGFERAWRAYPHYRNRSDRQKSLAAYAGLSGQEQADLMGAVDLFRAQPWISNEDGRYIRAFERWIEGDFWRDFVENTDTPAPLTRL